MAKFRVTAPDGTAHIVTAPDTATPDQVLAYAQQQFGGEQPAAPAVAPGADDPGKFMAALIGAGRTTDNVIDGMKQLGFTFTGNKDALEQLRQKHEGNDKAYQTLQDQHPVMTAVGEALPGMVIPAGGGASMAATVGRLAAAGAIPGALEYGTAGERAGRAAGGAAAAVTGGVVVPKVAGAVVNAVPAIGRTVRAVAEPLYEGGRQAIVGRTLNRAAGADAPAVAEKLTAAGAPALGPFQPGMAKTMAGEVVPGSIPTAAQVAENGGIAALERSAAAASPAEFATRGMEQSAARVGALRGVAGDDATRSAAVKARSTAADPLYEQAKGATYTMDEQLQRLLQTPAMQQAMARAKTLAENNQRGFTFEVPGHDVMTGLGNRTAGGSKQITGQGLQDLKMAVDAMLKDPAAGFAGAEGDALKGLRGNLLNWMESRNPVFKEARTTYAEKSKPIGQMDVGRELLTRLEPALNDFGGLARETGAKYATALRNADQTAVKATKFKGQGMDDLMTPQQMGTLEGVATDLARKANAQDLGRGPGSDTFQKMAMSNIAQMSGAPRVVGGALSLPGVSKVAKFLYAEPEEKIQTAIAKALLDPAEAGRLMTTNVIPPRAAAKDLLFANPARATQLLGGAAGMTAGNLFAQ